MHAPHDGARHFSDPWIGLHQAALVTSHQHGIHIPVWSGSVYVHVILCMCSTIQAMYTHTLTFRVSACVYVCDCTWQAALPRVPLRETSLPLRSTSQRSTKCLMIPTSTTTSHLSPHPRTRGRTGTRDTARDVAAPLRTRGLRDEPFLSPAEVTGLRHTRAVHRWYSVLIKMIWDREELPRVQRVVIRHREELTRVERVVMQDREELIRDKRVVIQDTKGNWFQVNWKLHWTS